MTLPHDRAWIVAVGLLAVAAVAVALATARPSQAPLHLLVFDGTPSAEGSIAYISGAIERPGVYPLRPGERLYELIDAAGGQSPDADAGSLNLARRVADGEHVEVPRRGAAPAVVRVRINHASRDELVTLPGFSVAQAAAVYASVRKVGPLTSMGDLLGRRLISAAQADAVAAFVDFAP